MAQARVPLVMAITPSSFPDSVMIEAPSPGGIPAGVEGKATQNPCMKWYWEAVILTDLEPWGMLSFWHSSPATANDGRKKNPKIKKGASCLALLQFIAFLITASSWGMRPDLCWKVRYPSLAVGMKSR